MYLAFCTVLFTFGIHFVNALLTIACRGYMAPEYVVQGKLTEKVDVFSFGVLLVEIMTGRKTSFQSQDTVSALQMVMVPFSINPQLVVHIEVQKTRTTKLVCLLRFGVSTLQIDCWKLWILFYKAIFRQRRRLERFKLGSFVLKHLLS